MRRAWSPGHPQGSHPWHNLSPTRSCITVPHPPEAWTTLSLNVFWGALGRPVPQKPPSRRAREEHDTSSTGGTWCGDVDPHERTLRSATTNPNPSSSLRNPLHGSRAGTLAAPPC
ncbi:hypothetical protein NN561_017058 [Cricetulus griseus]